MGQVENLLCDEYRGERALVFGWGRTVSVSMVKDPCPPRLKHIHSPIPTSLKIPKTVFDSQFPTGKKRQIFASAHFQQSDRYSVGRG